ncbi:hypothetical protein LSH36_272g04061 [Paralvinella palmiformis]|uniref:5'-nucleotidase n=1 Tax=Paralvinella palmiformis TaxID=53620 RepID=A0AAD9JJL3_9ANNE|nr:hypothetical protein LSH36_272g04061 [Paralvinella palmiformis]
METVCISVLILLIVTVMGDFNVTLLHTNDVHARVEQTDKHSSNCTESDAAADLCYAGVARRYTAIKEMQRNHGNVLLLDAGDEFQGTAWFSFYNGLEASHFMNRLGYDAMAIGNHEFDNGPSGLLSPFLENVSFPVLACNVNFTNYPEIRARIQPYITVDLTGGTVGIIGYITPITSILIDPKKNENITFGEIDPCVRECVTELENRGINKIIALGHSGYSYSQEVAKIPGVDIVIDGHSHTLLYNGDPPSNEEVGGPYPTQIAQPDGGVAIVYQAYAYGKYLGMAEVTFDDEGKVKNWSGNPILLDNNWQQDPEILTEVEKWRQPLAARTKVEVGESYVFLEGGAPYCRVRECNLGNMFTDAIFYKHLRPPTDSGWTRVRIVLWNGGGIRISLKKGLITAGNLVEIHPFRNLVEEIWISGAILRKAFEHSITALDSSSSSGRFLQISGLKVNYDLTRPEGSRVVDIWENCIDCDYPRYRPVEDNETYHVLTNGYLVAGGDGYIMLRDNLLKRLPIGTLATDALEYYIKKMTPVYPGLEGRIVFGNSETNHDDNNVDDCPTSVSDATSMNDVSKIAIVYLVLFYNVFNISP